MTVSASLFFWIVAVAGVATSVYQTNDKYTAPGGGFTTSLWKSCMLKSGTCRDIDDSAFPCESLGSLLRSARAFDILAILAIALQFVLSLLGFFELRSVVGVITRNVMIGVALMTHLFLLIGAATTAALFTLPQCTDHADRMAARDVDYISLGPSCVLMFIVAFAELVLCLVQVFLFHEEVPGGGAGDKYKKDGGAPAGGDPKKKEEPAKPAAAGDAAKKPPAPPADGKKEPPPPRGKDANSKPGARPADGK